MKGVLSYFEIAVVQGKFVYVQTKDVYLPYQVFHISVRCQTVEFLWKTFFISFNGNM